MSAGDARSPVPVAAAATTRSTGASGAGGWRQRVNPPIYIYLSGVRGSPVALYLGLVVHPSPVARRGRALSCAGCSGGDAQHGSRVNPQPGCGRLEARLRGNGAVVAREPR